MDDILDWMTLSQVPGIGPAGFWNLVEYFGTPAAALSASVKELNQLLRESQVHCFAKVDEIRRQCSIQSKKLKDMGGVCLTCADSDYPSSLKELKDRPPVLYLLGHRHTLAGCNVAIVGSRAATSYGKRTSFSMARSLAAQGVGIISGLALGIDTESHRGALAAEGTTVAVLGCGVDTVYPRQNRDLFMEIKEKGTIISEYPLGTKPEGFRFPARNRIIAGMSRGVLVVEAARKSGSLITAQLALDEGREIFAVPGQVDSVKSEGSHWLLQQGAKLVQSAADILEELPVEQWHMGEQGNSAEILSTLDVGAAELLKLIEPYAMPRNELIERSGRDVAQVSELLLLLELEGLVEILPGDEVRCIATLTIT